MNDETKRIKITSSIVEGIKSMQEKDMFEDIFEIKNQVKLTSIKNIKQNLIDLKDYVKEMQKKSMQNARR
jgi:hypothetical protein